MVGLGLAFVLPTIFGRSKNAAHDRKRLNAAIYQERISDLEQQHRDNKINDAEFARFRHEIRQSAFSDLEREGISTTRQDGTRGNKFLAVFLAITIPITAFGLYFQLGRPDLLINAAEHAAPSQKPGFQSPAGSLQQPAIEEMVDRLASRLQENPDDPEGWLMLGRSYSMMGHLDEALASLAKAYQRWPDNPEILVSYAKLLAQHNNDSMDGKPAELIQSALQLNPDFPPALWLAGVAAYQQDMPTDAIRYWEQLQKKGEISQQEQQVLTELLEEARQMVKSQKTSD